MGVTEVNKVKFKGMVLKHDSYVTQRAIGTSCMIALTKVNKTQV